MISLIIHVICLQLKVGDKLFVNYNFDDPGSLGFWYDARVINYTLKGLPHICTSKVL